jgi:hypothetical protein
VQCLVFACRFDEAEETASQYPILTSGKKEGLAEAFLSQRSYDSRAVPAEEKDYLKVLEILWPIEE